MKYGAEAVVDAYKGSFECANRYLGSGYWVVSAVLREKIKEPDGEREDIEIHFVTNCPGAVLQLATTRGSNKYDYKPLPGLLPCSSTLTKEKFAMCTFIECSDMHGKDTYMVQYRWFDCKRENELEKVLDKVNGFKYKVLVDNKVKGETIGYCIDFK